MSFSLDLASEEGPNISPSRDLSSKDNINSSPSLAPEEQQEFPLLQEVGQGHHPLGLGHLGMRGRLETTGSMA